MTCIPPFVAAVLLPASFVLGANNDDSIDPASVDDITLALSRLAIETNADEIPDQTFHAAKTAALTGFSSHCDKLCVRIDKSLCPTPAPLIQIVLARTCSEAF